MSDFAVGLIVQPLNIAKEFKAIPCLMELTTTMGFSFCGVSFANVALISIERLLALRYHLTDGTMVTPPRVLVALVLTCLVYFLLLNKFWVPPEFIYAGVALTFLYTMAATVSYICMYKIARRHQRQIHDQWQF